MQLELEIFRQLQMKRKEAPRPSESSDNSAVSGRSGPSSRGVTGQVSTSSAGPVSSSVGGPSSSLSSSSSSNPLSAHKSLTNLCTDPASTSGHADLTQSSTGQCQPVVSLSPPQPTTNSSNSTGVTSPHHRATQHLIKPTTPSSADTVSDTLVTLSQGVSQPAGTVSDMSSVVAAVLGKPATLSQEIVDNSADIQLEDVSSPHVDSTTSTTSSTTEL